MEIGRRDVPRDVLGYSQATRDYTVSELISGHLSLQRADGIQERFGIPPRCTVLFPSSIQTFLHCEQTLPLRLALLAERTPQDVLCLSPYGFQSAAGSLSVPIYRSQTVACAHLEELVAGVERLSEMDGVGRLVAQEGPADEWDAGADCLQDAVEAGM